MLGLRGGRRARIVGAAVVMTVTVAAPGVPALGAGRPEVVGQWTGPFEEGGAATPRCRPADDGTASMVCKATAVETAVLGDGRVFYFNGIESQGDSRGPTATWLEPEAHDSQARVLDLRSGTPEWIRPGPERDDLFCADITALPDGRLLMAGGTDRYNATLFDPKTKTFHQAAPMKHGRWYPHVAIGPDGNATVFGGATPLVGDTRLGHVRRTETYHADTNTWEENNVGPASENELPLQPRIVLAPNGKFFYAAVGQMWGPFGQSPDEATTALYQFYDPKTKRWSVSGLAPLGARSGAFVVPLTLQPPYDQMTLVTFGGVLGPTPVSWLPASALTTLTTIDGNGAVSDRMTGKLNHARWFASGVLLPDGQVLAVGGDDKDDAFGPGLGIAVKTPELYNPATGTWSDVAAHRRDRGYHSSALLLPDMRVLLGGNAPIAAGHGGAHHDMGRPFANNDNDPSFEIWSPPYLFRGSRPVVKRVQRAVGYGEPFDITTPDAGLIESVLLMRTPSPEHANDSDQRALRLEFSRSSADTLTATAPPSGTVAPPGSYYLVVNKKSLEGPIPSVARMVDVGHTDLADALQPYADDAPAPVNGSATPDEDSSRAPVLSRR